MLDSFSFKLVAQGTPEQAIRFTHASGAEDDYPAADIAITGEAEADFRTVYAKLLRLGVVTVPNPAYLPPEPT